MKRLAFALRRAVCCGALASILGGPVGRAADATPPPPPLLGADAVLRELTGATAAAAPADDGSAPVAAFVASAREFKARATGLDPSAAAGQWLALWDRSRRIGDGGASGYRIRGSLVNILLSVVPRPESWPEIERIVQERLAAQSPPGATITDLSNLLFSGGRRPGANGLAGQRIFSLLLQEKFGDAAALADLQASGFGDMIRRMQESVQPPAFATRLEATLARKDDPYGGLVIPDLLPKLGPERTRAIARRVLLAPRAVRVTVKGGGTLALFRDEALALVGELPRPPWDLCQGLGGGPLQAALITRFGDPLAPGAVKPDADSAAQAAAEAAVEATQWRAIEALRGRQQAEAVRLVTLIASNLPGASTLRENDVDPAFAFEVLAEASLKTPSPDLLPLMLGLAPSAGPTDQVLPVIRRAWAANSAGRPLWIAQLEVALRLANDEIDPAIAALRSVLQDSRKAAAAGARGDDGGDEATASDAPADAATVWVESASHAVLLGLTLGRDGLVSDGLSELETAIKTLPGNRRGEDALRYRPTEVAEQLTKAGRLADAERLCLLQLRRLTNDENRYHRNSVLAALAGVYDKAGRPADVLRLLTAAPQWEATDLAQLPHEDLWMAAARALAATGQPEPALKITRAQLEDRPGDDEAYALLLDLKGGDALPLLDQLAAADRWQERPLIWKAELLRRQGRLAEAESCARAALAIDPTDGEEVAGARVRGYAVLGDTLAALGKNDDAKFFRSVVSSVRIAETGDTLRAAGLREAARRKYEEAEVLFADAYCVQWRLAETLQRAGRTAEAEKHYEIAFARMPEQFGRMATLCFGCENVFGSEASRSAAERVLTRLAAAPNPRPQVFLILARLRLEQNRPTDAWNEFQRAVSLDPDHLDAWVDLDRLIQAVDPTIEQRRVIMQRLCELDPANRHVGLDAESAGVLGLKRLWAMMQIPGTRPAPAAELLALPAAARRIQSSDQGRYLREKLKQQALFGEFADENVGSGSDRLFLAWLRPVNMILGAGFDD